MNCFCRAPEVLTGQGYGKAVDWWSYGSLIFEMLSGLPPFYSQDVQEMYRKILSDPLTFPAYFTHETCDLHSKLLEREAEKRLIDPNMIKGHPFLNGVDWEALFNKRIPPPFIPTVSGRADVSQIDPAFTSEKPTHAIEGVANGAIAPSEQTNFTGFTYVAPSPLKQ